MRPAGRLSGRGQEEEPPRLEGAHRADQLAQVVVEKEEIDPQLDEEIEDELPDDDEDTVADDDEIIDESANED